MTIRLHVERLAIDGIALSGAERARLERAVVGELTRLLEAEHGSARARGILGDGGAVAMLRGNELRMEHGESGSALGVRVARSVYGAMMPPARGGDGTAAPSVRRAESVR